jgi:hypothetical protein
VSRKRNTRRGGKKARLYGGNSNLGLSRHRKSGRSGRHRRALADEARERNRKDDERRLTKKRRRNKPYASVQDLMANEGHR